MEKIDLKEVVKAIYARIEDYDRDENQLFYDDCIPFGNPHLIYIHMRIDANYDSSSQSRPEIKEIHIWNPNNDIESAIELDSTKRFDVEELLYELLSCDIEQVCSTPRSKMPIHHITN